MTEKACYHHGYRHPPDGGPVPCGAQAPIFELGAEEEINRENE